MTANRLPGRPVAWYVAGVLALSFGIMAILYELFRSRVPEFTEEFVRSPTVAIQNDPVAVVLVLTAFVATLLLIGLIIGFGARYGPDRQRRRQQSE